jgi:hypothetical protein
VVAAIITLAGCGADEGIDVAEGWKHLSSATGDMPVPVVGQEQTASLLVDIDGSGVDDIIITERTASPSVICLRRTGDGWARLVIDDTPLRIEAGGASHDIDGDGDLDLVFGGDYRSPEVWWWENPSPDLNPDRPWQRRLIKSSGANKHHDEIFGDFDGDGAEDLVFWNQGAKSLMLAAIPADPQSALDWPTRAIYSWEDGAEHEGLAAADIDRDGTLDIVGGGNWYRHEESGTFSAHVIDSAMAFTRAAAGQLKAGGRSEVVFGPGDADGALKWYEWDGATWIGHVLEPELRHGHSLALSDFDQDGHLDVFVAEMGRWGRSSHNADARAIVFYGDGVGGFQRRVIVRGVGHHESRPGDLDGDGDVDILAKPYNWRTPRVNVFLNGGTGSGPQRAERLGMDRWRRHEIDHLPSRAVQVLAEDLDGDGRIDIAAGAWWWRQGKALDGDWERREIGGELHNVAIVRDLDGDGLLDLLGTKGEGASANAEFLWARGEGHGAFSMRENIPAADGDFLQGVAAARFRKEGPLEIALSWHQSGLGVQFLTVPSNPVQDRWGWRRVINTSQDEDLSTGDIDRDGDIDLLLGTIWLENRSRHWVDHTIGAVNRGTPDRNDLVDIDGDGRLDAVVGLENGTDVLWFRQGDDPRERWQPHRIARNVGGGFSMDCADFDGDGDPDVVLGEHRGRSENRVLIFENRAWGSEWTAHLVDSGPKDEIDHHDGTQAVDIDADGDLDIVSLGWYTPKVWLYENLAVQANRSPGHLGD